MADSIETANPTTIIVQKQTSALGIGATVCGIISIFFLAPLFGTLAFILGGIGVAKKQFVLSGIGLLTGVIGLLTSPILYAMLGLSFL